MATGNLVRTVTGMQGAFLLPYSRHSNFISLNSSTLAEKVKSTCPEVSHVPFVLILQPCSETPRQIATRALSSTPKLLGSHLFKTKDNSGQPLSWMARLARVCAPNTISLVVALSFFTSHHSQPRYFKETLVLPTTAMCKHRDTGKKIKIT